MPVVSVIVPNYNHERYLPKRLESILNQTFTDFELIFLDDASTDNSLRIFKRYAADPRIRTTLNTTNSGSPFKQWNRGIAMASGKYIWIAESDDFSDSLFLETLVPLLENHQSCSLVFCQSLFVDKQDRVVGPFSYGQFSDNRRWRSDFQAAGKSELRRYFAISNVIPNASAVLFRAETVRGSTLAPENMHLAGDWMFWVRLLEKNDMVYVAKPLNYFRGVHEDSQRFRSTNAGLEILEGLDVLEQIEYMVGLSRSQKSRAIGMRIRHWMLVRRSGCLDDEVDRKIFGRFIKIADGVYGNNPTAVRLQVLLRAVLYSTIQQPVLKRTLGPIRALIRRTLNSPQDTP